MFTYLLATMLFLAPAENDVKAKDGMVIARRWAEAQESVTSVRTTFDCYSYDFIFQVVEVTSGEVIVLSPDKGLWSIVPHTSKASTKVIKRGGTTFALKKARSSRTVWDGSKITVIDDQSKHADKFPSQGRFFRNRFFPSVTEMSPFLPGLPNGTTISEWTFTIESETEKEVRLKALPVRSDNPWFKSCNLILRKPDLTLHAINFANAAGTRETVLVFKTVEVNPKSMPEIDLSGYSINAGAPTN